jgi:hypothetical protein
VLLKVEQDCRRLDHVEVAPRAVDERRDAPIRIELDIPGFVLLAFGEVNGVYAARGGRRVRDSSASARERGRSCALVVEAVEGLELLQEDGGNVAVRRTGGVEQEWLSSGHCC